MAEPASDAPANPDLAPDPAPMATPGPVPQVLALDGCQGILTMTPFPESLVGAEPIPGWDGSPTGLAEVHLEGYVCERLSIDRFERGPLGIAFEFYAANGGPPACTEGSWTTKERLHALWIEDAEVAAHLEQLGVPVHLATFALEPGSAMPVAQPRLTISADGGGTADLRVTAMDSADQSETSHTYRFVWTKGTGLGLMDMALTWEAAAYSAPLVTATMPAPFLASHAGSDTLVGYGGAVTATGRGPIQTFGDPACEQPL